MLIERGAVRVGMEIEIALFKEGSSYQKVAQRLIDAGFMEGKMDDWQEYHRYGCTCVLGCGTVRSGNVIDPPLVSLTYDASLPRSGAEFVTSPVVIGPYGLQPLRPIWDIVTEKAVWNNKLADRNGGIASPSIHLHVSVDTASGKDYNEPARSPREAEATRDDCMHALSLFAPEFIALASAAGYKRGLAYRKPTRFPDGQRGHHGFIHIRNIIPKRKVYIEWRMFEAAYDNWDYVESAAFLAAALTRALLKPDAISHLMAGGYNYPFDGGALNNAIRKDDTDALLKLVHLRRLNFLREFCLEQLDDDIEGARLVRVLFENTEKLYGG